MVAALGAAARGGARRGAGGGRSWGALALWSGLAPGQAQSRQPAQRRNSCGCGRHQPQQWRPGVTGGWGLM